MTRKLTILFIILTAGAIGLLTYQRSLSGKRHSQVCIDLDSIRKRGKLIAVTDFNSVDYFIYKGEPMGFNYELLNSFSDFIGIDVELIAENSIERAIGMLNNGEADLLVTGMDSSTVNIPEIVLSEPITSLCRPDIKIDTVAGTNCSLSWSVRKSNSEDLLKELNRWILSFRNTTTYAMLNAKYFSNPNYGTMVRSDYYSINSGKVSRYDDMIREFSASIDWDWRLLASLICQESEFKPDVVSMRGAYGLMQIMPITGRNFGIDIKASPENNLRAGILYINWLNSIFEPKVPDRTERLNFILAAYNAGPGHVLDAMRLAEKNGMDPGKWDGSVAVWLLKKSEPRYYRDSVVRNGYFRGRESVKFVTEVLDRFGHYKNIIPEQKSRPYGE